MARSPTEKQAAYIKARNEGMKRVDAYALAYNCPDLDRGEASRRAGKVERQPHILARIQQFEQAVVAEVAKAHVERITDHQEEVRDKLRVLIDHAIVSGAYRDALDGIKSLGSIDNCANFVEHAAPAPAPQGAGNTTINLNAGAGEGSPLDQLQSSLAKSKTIEHRPAESVN